jgi:hypothetical protein
MQQRTELCLCTFYVAQTLTVMTSEDHIDLEAPNNHIEFEIFSTYGRISHRVAKIWYLCRIRPDAATDTLLIYMNSTDDIDFDGAK